MGDAGGVTLLETKIGSKAPCPLLRNVDGSMTSLADVLDAIQTDTQDFIVKGPVVDLSGTGSTEIICFGDQAYTLVSAKFIYTEASSSDTGVNLTVGKLIEGTDDADYFVEAVATEVSKETGYDQDLTLAETAVAAGDVLTMTSAGSKTGTGEGFIQLTLRKA